MTELECQRCGYEWNYTGEQEHYCTCPACMTSVPVDRTVAEVAEDVDGADVVDESAGSEVVIELDGEVQELSVEEAIQELADRVSS